MAELNVDKMARIVAARAMETECIHNVSNTIPKSTENVADMETELNLTELNRTELLKDHVRVADTHEKKAYSETMEGLLDSGAFVAWIPVSERLPEELEPVNITWINHNPESYYADIKDKPFTATGVYFNGQWYWWSTLCTDILTEYGHNYDDIIDDDIEITAWMPLPEPWEGESE